MDLQQLSALIAVAEEHSFSRAAERLFLTQPAVSMQIRRLEEELGQTLVDRGGRQVVPTQAGALLVEHAQRIFEELAEARRHLAELEGLARGTLSVGCSDTLSRHYLAPQLGRYLERYPGVEVNLLNRTTPEIIDLVTQRSLDLGFIILPVADQHLEVRRLFAYREVAICANDHPLARRKRATVREISRHSLLLLEQGTRSRALLDRAFADEGVSPHRPIELGSVELQIELAAIGLGVAIVPGYAIAGLPVRLRRVEIRPSLDRQIAVIHHSDRSPPATARALLEML